MKTTKLLSIFFVFLVVFLIAGDVQAAWYFWGGGVSNNWLTNGNWTADAQGTPITGSPGSGDVAFIGTGSGVMYSGASVTVNDFTMTANNSDYVGNASLTINSGASLHSNANIDLGYYSGSETVTLTVNSGASLSCPGYFPGDRSGTRYINIGGDVSIGVVNLNSTTYIDFGLAGTLTIVGDSVDTINNWVVSGNITDRGVAYGQSGWGQTYEIIATYNAAINRTIVISLGGMVDAMSYGSNYNDTTISAALTAIGTSYKTLYLEPATWQINNNLTIPQNVTLQFDQGAILNVASGITLTINGPINFFGTLGQIFSGTGTKHCGTGIYQVYPQWWGSVGTADDTVVCQAALNSGAKIIRFPSGTYNIDADGTGNQFAGLQLPSNVTLLFDTGSKLKAISGSSDTYSVLNITDKTNVTIIGANIEGERHTHSGTTGEWGMGIFIAGTSSQIYIGDVNSHDCWGDGIYINGDVNGITVENSIFDHNRRTGCVIICGKNILFTNCIFSHTDGTSTYCGVRLEPNYDSDYLQNIRFEDCYSQWNTTKGFSVAYGLGTRSLNTPISVTFLRCTSNNDGIGFNVEAGPLNNNGKVYITDCVCNSPLETGFSGINTNTPVEIDGLQITDPNQKYPYNTNPRDACGMVVWVASGETGYLAGNITAQNVSISSTDGKAPYALWFQNDGGVGTGFDNINISLTTDMPSNKRLYKGTGPYTNFTIAFLLPFIDGFEGGNFTAGSWTTQNGNSSVATAAKYTGTYGAKNAGTTWMQKMQSTVGYNTIHVKYDRKTAGMDSSEYLYVEWSTDGSTWNNLESTKQTAWASKDFTCSTGANNNANFRVRFRTNANNASTEYAYVDNVQIIGTGI